MGTELKLNTCSVFGFISDYPVDNVCTCGYMQTTLIICGLSRLYKRYWLKSLTFVYLIYLIDCVYIFSGVQRQLTYDMVHNDDPSSVQGLLEYAFKQLQPLNTPKLHLSSRWVNILYSIDQFCKMLKP